MSQNRAAHGHARTLSLLIIVWVLALGTVLIANLSFAAEDSALNSLQTYWRTQAPWCRFSSADGIAKKPTAKEFGSKNDDGAGSNTPPCNDGDSIMFNALLCLAGVKVEIGQDRAAAGGEGVVKEVGCDVVKHSQTLEVGSADYGRWWRSPRRNYLASLSQQPEGGSETTFSNDHALGVMAYIAQTKDVTAFQAWTDWIKTKGGICSSMSCIPGLPRYCPDDRCGFKLADCPLLDELAKYLGRENALCASDSVKEAQARAWAMADVLLLPFNFFLPQLNDIIDKYGAGKQGAHSAGRIAIINSITNDQGYALHDVAVIVYLFREFGLANRAETQIAADILYARAGDNAFLEFVANGPTTGVKGKIVGTCPSQQNDIPHPKFQWIWERQNIPETAKKTMYWDCVFIANAFMKGDYSPPPAMPGMMELAIDIADARKLVHATCMDCKNIDCSGRDIDCGHKKPIEKFLCEVSKKQTMLKCEGKKFVCTSTCE